MDFLSLSPANEMGDKIVRKRIIDTAWWDAQYGFKTIYLVPYKSVVSLCVMASLRWDKQDGH